MFYVHASAMAAGLLNKHRPVTSVLHNIPSTTWHILSDHFFIYMLHVTTREVSYTPSKSSEVLHCLNHSLKFPASWIILLSWSILQQHNISELKTLDTIDVMMGRLPQMWRQSFYIQIEIEGDVFGNAQSTDRHRTLRKAKFEAEEDSGCWVIWIWIVHFSIPYTTVSGYLKTTEVANCWLIEGNAMPCLHLNWDYLAEEPVFLKLEPLDLVSFLLVYSQAHCSTQRHFKLQKKHLMIIIIIIKKPNNTGL